MSEVTIQFSKKDFKQLVKHVFIGNWIIAALKEDDEPDTELEDFYNKILELVKNNSLTNDIEFDEESAKYNLKPKKEDEFISEIEEFGQNIFWEQLVEELAKRDVIKKHGRRKIKQLPLDEYVAFLEEEREKYINEFSENFLENLKIVKFEKEL